MQEVNREKVNKNSRISKTEEDIGERVRIARTRIGWTLEELAEKVGVTHSYISSIERGIKTPSRHVRASLIRALGDMLGLDPADRLAEYLTDEEISLIKLWRRLPRNVREYHIKAFRAYLEEDG